jgi:hypothetical protein
MALTEPARTPRNVPGPFYVAKDQCTTCGAPEVEAPSLIRHDDEHGCYFYRQPENADDTYHALRAMRVSCLASVRYGGTDPDILQRAADVGSANQCDHPVRTRQAPPRTHVTFRLDALDVETVARSLASAVAPSDDGAGRWVAIVDLDVGTIDDALRSLAGVSDLRWYTTEEYRGRRRQWTKYPI